MERDCVPSYFHSLNAASLKESKGLRKYSRRLGLAVTESVLTTGVVASCGHLIFSTSTMTHTPWFVLSFGSFMVGCVGVSAIKPKSCMDKDGDRYTENTWHRIFCHNLISVGSGMVLAPMVALHPGNCAVAMGLTGGVSAGMLFYSLTKPRGDLLKWGPVLYSCISGLGVLMLMTSFGSIVFPSLRLGARWIYMLLGLPMFSALIGFDINRSLYKYEALGESDHLGDSVDIFLDMYNLMQILVQLLGQEEDK